MEDSALKVVNAYKSFDEENVILKGLNLNIKKGAIYGLVGPSGCGKTTLLQCVLGLERLDHGLVECIYTKKSDVGYMPQEISLNEDLNLEELFNYFLRIYNMDPKQGKEKVNELVKTLHLPPLERIMKYLSGGEKRRVSLAVTLLHEPKLLILDEPTVGADALLRESIWNILFMMARENSKTVIVTTHYIEEVRPTDRVGFMRKGIIVEEDHPESILLKQNCNSLEEVFLKISYGQDDQETQEDKFPKKSDKPSDPPFNKNQTVFRWNRFKAEFIKDCNIMHRNLEMLPFIIGLVVIAIVSHKLAAGQDLVFLKVGVVNKEFNDTWNNCHNIDNLIKAQNDTCDMQMLSCKYIKHLERQSINLIYFDTLNDGIRSVKKNDVWAIVSFPFNFTNLLMERLDHGIYASDQSIENGLVNIYSDGTDYNIYKFLFNKFYKAMASSMEEIFKECKWNENFAKSPIRFNYPIYGNNEFSFRLDSTPGLVLLMIFNFPQAYIFMVVMEEKKSKFANRSMVSGVSLFEILSGHFVMQCVILVGQCICGIVSAYYFFDTPFGQPLASTLTIFLTGICGSMFGIMSSALFDNHTAATGMLVGMFIISTFLGGSMWPFEGIQSIVKIWTKIFVPVSPAVESLRKSTYRSWGFEHLDIWMGYFSLIVWTIIYMILTVLIFKLRGGRFSR